MSVHKISTVQFASLENEKGYNGEDGTQDNYVLNTISISCHGKLKESRISD
jgi:hypothetical protein